QAVIVPRDKSASLTPTVRKVACGAAEAVPLIRVTNLARCLRELQGLGLWVVGTAGEAEDTVYQADLTGPLALVMGAEGKGMRRLTREHCDRLVRLPMQGTVGSLNVSVATGVCLYEAMRQRLA
ncbi:MAG TPA: 23S rRNA (guanosine(2251)-2'-O)-methyltransferase RlmB, partial [Marinobacter sp.]|nr:23S rRNA (guanosine(2251)-2'-O)-methyltransferase RlmB [Marinobacter sp.]